MPRFIPFVEQALSFSSAKSKNYLCAVKLSAKYKASCKLTREEKTTSIIFLLLK